MKVSVMKVTVQDQTQYMVSWRPPGAKRIGHYHPTKKLADVERDTVEAQFKQAGHVWGALPAEERNAVIHAFQEAQGRGYTLQEASDFYWQYRDLGRLADLPALVVLLRQAKAEGATIQEAVEYYREGRGDFADGGEGGLQVVAGGPETAAGGGQELRARRTPITREDLPVASCIRRWRG